MSATWGYASGGTTSSSRVRSGSLSSCWSSAATAFTQGSAVGLMPSSQMAWSANVRCSLPSPEHLSSSRSGPSLSVPSGAIAPRRSASRSKSGARLRATSGLPLHRQDVLRDRGQHVGLPARQRLLPLRLVERVVVDPGHGALGSADVVDRGLDHVRRHADAVEAGGEGSTQIVNLPV